MSLGASEGLSPNKHLRARMRTNQTNHSRRGAPSKGRKTMLRRQILTLAASALALGSLAFGVQAEQDHRAGVTISTLHAVKGLEYDIVYILNVNEGSIPYRKAVLAEAVEEERRLFYVGMTRAKKKLVLSYVRHQYEKEREPSRFLEETGL